MKNLISRLTDKVYSLRGQTTLRAALLLITLDGLCLGGAFALIFGNLWISLFAGLILAYFIVGAASWIAAYIERKRNSNKVRFNEV